jgi:hypothetical protein
MRFTLQYQVPELRNAGLGFASSRIGSAILSGWGLGTYLSYQSAGLVTRPSSNGTTPINQFLGYGPGTAQLKTDADGNYMNPWSVDWVDYDGNRRTDPLNINCRCFDPTKTIVFNPNAWTNIPDGQFGAQQASLRFFRGQRQPEENVNFSRNFRFGRDGRFNLNVRVEFNNIFNRTRFLTPAGGSAIVTGGNFAQAPTRFTSGVNTGLYSGGWGTMNVLGGTSGQRTGTFVGRFTF